jgi:hypothetical protein
MAFVSARRILRIFIVCHEGVTFPEDAMWQEMNHDLNEQLRERRQALSATRMVLRAWGEDAPPCLNPRRQMRKMKR